MIHQLSPCHIVDLLGSASVPHRQLQFGPQICDDYPGCPSRSDSSDEMSELDDSEVDDISKDDDELLFLAKRFYDLLPVPANTK